MPDKPSTTDLLPRLADDAEARELVWERWRSEFHRHASRELRYPRRAVLAAKGGDSEDVAEDAFLLTIEGLATSQHGEPFEKPKIATREKFDQLVKGNIDAVVSRIGKTLTAAWARETPLGDAEPASSPSDFAHLSDAQREAALDHAIEAVEAGLGVTTASICLAWREGESTKEIARSLDKSQQYVTGRIQAALRWLACHSSNDNDL